MYVMPPLPQQYVNCLNSEAGTVLADALNLNASSRGKDGYTKEGRAGGHVECAART
jgi:hypothetical protein